MKFFFPTLVLQSSTESYCGRPKQKVEASCIEHLGISSFLCFLLWFLFYKFINLFSSHICTANNTIGTLWVAEQVVDGNLDELYEPKACNKILIHCWGQDFDWLTSYDSLLDIFSTLCLGLFVCWFANSEHFAEMNRNFYIVDLFSSW
jgi:hypothetical protein